MEHEAVGVRHLGGWLPATVLWEETEHGRRWALVEVETDAGQVEQQLHWYDELLRGSRVLALRRSG